MNKTGGTKSGNRLKLAVFAGLLMLAFIACPRLVGETIVIPDEAAAVEGTGYSLTLFNLGRQQEIYHSSMFPRTPILINGIWFRPDVIGGPVPGRAFSTTVSNIMVSLSTSVKAPNGQSMSFAENVGADSNTVFYGSLAVSSAAVNATGGAKAFDIYIPFQKPFRYDPSKGNLVVDFKNFSGSAATSCDGAGNSGKSSRIWSTNPNGFSATGSDHGADVLQLAYIVAPDLSLLQNGSFENGFTGWTQTGYNTINGPDQNAYAVGTDGTHAGAIGTFDVPGSSLSQVVNLAGPTNYLLGFDWFSDAVAVAGKTGVLSVTVTDSKSRVLASSLFTNVSVATPKLGAVNFVPASIVFATLADSGAITLKFADASPAGGLAVDIILDHIVLTPTQQIPPVVSSLVQNGSFEQGFNGWTQTGYNTINGPDQNAYAVGTDGTHAAAIGTFDVPGSSLSQVVNLAGPTNYLLGFDWFSDAVAVAGKTGVLSVVVTDSKARVLASSLFTNVSVATPKLGAVNFVPASVVFATLADSGAITLKFADASPAGGLAVDIILDRIVLTPTQQIPPIITGLVQNGSFENGFTGWTQTGYNTVLGTEWNGFAVGTDGTHAAALGTFDVAGSTIAQTINLAGPTNYILNFDWFTDALGAVGKTGMLSVFVTDSKSRLLAAASFTNVSSATLKYGNLNFKTEGVTFATLTDSGAVTVKLTDVSASGGKAFDVILDRIVLTPTKPAPLIPIALQNGSFENGFNSWVLTGYNLVLGKELNGVTVASDGRHAAEIGSLGTAGSSIAQSVNLPGSTNCVLSFDWYLDASSMRGKAGTLYVLITDSKSRVLANSILNGTSSSMPKYGANNFHPDSVAFATFADSGMVTIRFSNRTMVNVRGVSLVLDNVRLEGKPAVRTLSLNQVGSENRIQSRAMSGVNLAAATNPKTPVGPSAPITSSGPVHKATANELTLSALLAGLDSRLTLDAVQFQFDELFYLANNADALTALQNGEVTSGLEHFLSIGLRHNCQPNLLFSDSYYLEQNPLAALAVATRQTGSGFEHFLLVGQQAGLAFNQFFDEEFYLENNLDVAALVASGVWRSGAEHYMAAGRFEGRLAVAAE